MKIKRIPPIILVTMAVSQVMYETFTPWYIKLWHRIKRFSRKVKKNITLASKEK